MKSTYEKDVARHVRKYEREFLRAFGAVRLKPNAKRIAFLAGCMCARIRAGLGGDVIEAARNLRPYLREIK